MKLSRCMLVVSFLTASLMSFGIEAIFDASLISLLGSQRNKEDNEEKEYTFHVFISNTLDEEFADADIEVISWPKGKKTHTVIKPNGKEYIGSIKNLETQKDGDLDILLEISYKNTQHGFLRITSKTNTIKKKLSQASLIDGWNRLDTTDEEDLVMHITNDDIHYNSKAHFGRKKSKSLGNFFRGFNRKN